MSNAKNTPGPWYMKPAPYGWDVWGNLDNGSDTWVGPVRRVISPHSRVHSAGAIEAEGAETEANARLIAAAPDLFKALVLLYETGAPSGLALTADDMTARFAAARAAIAKARGE